MSKRDTPHVFGKVVIAARESKGFNQYQFERRSGKPHSTITRLEKGQNEPTISTIIWVARAIGMEPPELFARLYEALLEEEHRENAR